MRVHHEEGVANHLGPEPCVSIREGEDEPSAGERTGQPLSHVRSQNPGRRRVSDRGRQHGRARDRERPDGPAWSETLACADAPCAGTGRSRVRPGMGHRPGPRREGEEPSLPMHGRDKSDLAIVATKLANKAGQQAAESVERRAEAEGNARQQSTRRAQDRASVT